MITVSVFYPNRPGSRFDLDYYVNKHMPMAIEGLGAALKELRVENGLSGRAPGSPPEYVAITHMRFESEEAFRAAYGAVGPSLRADVPNYTDVEPLMQINGCKMAR